MKKTLRSILTVLLVFVMLFCALAPAVSATSAETGSTGSNAPALDQGWIEIAYNADEISVILRPDKEDLLDVSLSGLKSILTTVIDAVQVVVLDDIMADFADDKYGIDGTTDINTIFDYAFSHYLEKNGYADDIAFFQAAYEDSTNAVITSLADYICQLLYDSVRAEVFELSELPTVDKIKNDFYSVYDDVVGELVGVDATVTANRAAYADIVADKYADTLADLKDKPSMSTKEVLTYLESIKIDTYEILSTEDGEVAMFNKHDLVEFINSLPTFASLANTATADMAWSWNITLTTAFGSSNFDLSVALGEGENAEETELYGERIRRYAGLIEKNIGFEINHDDVIKVSLNVPETVSKIIKLALASDDVAPSFKHRFFVIFDTPVGEIEDKFNELTYAEIMAELEKVNFEGLLDTDTAKDFIDLSGLTNEQIINKLWNFENEYALLKSLVSDVLEAVPERYKEKSLLDLYYKDGAFAFDGSLNINIEKLFNAVTERYGAFLASFFDNAEFGSWTFDIDVTFENMNKVVYEVNGEPVSQGLLPYGASVLQFGPKDIDGLSIDYWVDETGALVDTMPTGDIVLSARHTLDSSLWSYTGPLTYNGSAQYITLTAVPDGYTVEYIYTLPDGTVIDCPKDAGSYIVSAIFKKNGEDACLEIKALEYTILPRTIDLSNVGWTNTDLVYNKTEQSVTLDVGSLLDGLTNVLTYTNNKSVKPCELTAEVKLHEALDTRNYRVILPAETSVKWTIAKADIDMSGVTVSDTVVNYDGKPHSVTYSGTLPEGVVVSTPSYHLPGTYTVTVNFEYTGEDKDCYNLIPGASATLKIVAERFWSYTGPLTYNGAAQPITVILVPDGYTVEYIYTLPDGTVIDCPKDAGSYIVSAVFTKNGEGASLEPVSLEYTILPRTIDLSNVGWTDTNLVYNKTEQSVTLDVGSLLDGLTNVLTYTNNKSVKPCNLTATVALHEALDTNNYVVILPAETSVEWTIAKADIDMSGVTVLPETVVDYDGKLHSALYSGTLPEGVVVSTPSYQLPGTYTVTVGFEYTGEDKDCYNLIPGANATLKIVAERFWNYTGPLTYNGSAQPITVILVPDGYTVEYIYTLPDGTVIDCPKDAGSYIVFAVFTKDGDATLEPVSCEYTILPRTIDLSNVGWTNTDLVYNKTEQSVTLDVGSLLDGLTNVLTYTGNTATKAGKFTATVAVSEEYNTNNYVVILPAETSVEWEIAKADIDMSGVTVLPETVVDYDGKLHSVTYEGTLPEGVDVSIPSYKLPGTYTVTVAFEYTGEDKDCYNPIPSAVVTLTIIPRYSYSFEFVDNAGKVIVSVDAENGILIDFKLLAADTSFAHTGYYLEDGSYVKVLLAYDINFAQDGIHQPVEDNLTVKMYLPENLREKDGIKLVYITNNGECEELEYTVDGDYVVFETNHFSTYALVEAADAPVPLTPPDLTWLWILLAVVGCLLVVGVIVLLVLRRRKKDDDTDPTEPDSEPTEPTEPESDDAIEEPRETTTEEAPAEEAPAEEAPAPEAPAEVEPAPVQKFAPITIRFADENEDGERRGDIDGEVVLVRFRTSFQSRYIQSGDLQDYYTAIKNLLLSYKGVKARTSWNCESFNKGRVQLAKVNIKGNALLVNLALDPALYSQSKYHFTDMSDKPKFEKTPMLMKVKSDRALKYTLELIAEMMKTLEIPEGKAQNVDYHLPYETTEALASRGLVKVILPAGMKLDENMSVIRVDVGELLADVKDDNNDAPEAPVAPEAPAEEAPVEEAPAPEASVEETVSENKNSLNIKYRTSFMARYIQSGDLQDYYTVIKNALLSYKGVKARISWNYESFNKGRVQLAKANVKGSTLYIYLALDPALYNKAKYHFSDVSDKSKFEKTPMLMKVRSNRALKYTLELIAEMMKTLEIPEGKPQNADYHLPYETTEALIERDLVKLLITEEKISSDDQCEEITPEAHEEPVEEIALEAVEEPIEAVVEEPVVEVHIPEIAEPIHVDAEHADEILTNEEAVATIQIVHTGANKRKGKLAVINLDVICENFDDGETVDLDTLRAKRLVPKNTARIKILARGIMTKALTVIASKYSLAAVKMIYLAGGVAEVED